MAGNVFVWFYFGTACDTIIFAVDTATTISHSLGKRYGPVLSLSFLDVYDSISNIVSTNNSSFSCFFN